MFRKKGLEKIQQYLVAGIRSDEVSGCEILDIGCGVGSLHLTLLKEGAARAVGVDVSEGMLEHAKNLALGMGLQDKTRYILGDFVHEAVSVPEADITLLDKVVCCYDDLERLIKTSAAKTRRTFALTYPRNNIPTRVLFKLLIFFSKLFRAKFHPYWHDWEYMKELIISRGFQPRFEKATITWQVLVLQRVQSSSS